MTALSVLDLAPIVAGETAAHALRKSLDLARHDIETYWTPQEKVHVTGMLKFPIVGSPQTVRRGL